MRFVISKLAAAIVGVVELGILAPSAHATFHLWHIDEVYSNADGSVQFIEFQQPSFTFDDERFLTEAAGGVKDSALGNSYTFTSDLPSQPAANSFFLMATPGYAALAGVPAPDYTFASNNFFSVAGDTITYASGISTFTFTSGQLPTDGVHSLNRPYGSTTIASGIASPTNFAGQSGTIPAPASVWLNPAGGSWAIATNWQNSSVPNSAGAAAVFGNAITAPQTITLDENVTVGTMTFNNTASYTIAPGGAFSLTMDNAAVDPAITVTAGSHQIAAPLQVGSKADLTIAAGAALKISGHLSGEFNSITLAGTTNAWTGKLDLTNNDLILHNGAAALANVVNQIKQGYNGGNWNGSGGITSSSAAASSSPKTALGYGSINGTFDGQAVTTSDLIVKYTLVGDTNLDGSVNFSDLLAVAQNYNKTTTTWTTGDFNYDSTTNFSDLLGLAQNYNKATSLTAAELSTLNTTNPSFASAFTQAQAATTVPEPATLSILSFTSLTLLPRRRRASRVPLL